MQDRTFTVEFLEPRRLVVRLSGLLEDGDVVKLSEDLLPRLRKVGTGGEIIIDLHEVKSCTTDARLRLIELQRGIAEQKARTAFVANRPRFRGVGLYVAHHSGDPKARAFHFTAQAQAWLGSSEGRTESLDGRRRRSPGQPRPRRLSSGEFLRRRAKRRESQDGESGDDS